MNPMPFVSQIITKNGNDHYYALDNHKLFDYNLQFNTLDTIYTLDNLPLLDNLSGFSLWDGGILFYDYKSSNVLISNKEDTTIKKIPISLDQGIDCWGISGTEVLGNDKVIYLSGPPKKESGFKEDYNNTTISINPMSRKINVGGKRSDIYREYLLGKDYFWRVYHTMDEDNNLYVSIPGSTDIYVFDSGLNLVREFTMSSRYNQMLQEAEPDLSHMEEKKFYLFQDSFGPITYDTASGLLYRIATHPFTRDNITGMTLKPFSIIVADKYGRMVTETQIINKDNSMFYDVMFATSIGLYMQILSEDENIVKFVIFRLNQDDI